jgi:hypothetical protein
MAVGEKRVRRGPREEGVRLLTLEELSARFEEPGRFLFIPGEEITDRIAGLPLHHNAVNNDRVIPPTGGASIREAMERTIAAVAAEARRAGRPVLVHLNHPNFGWAVSAKDLAAVLGERFFEVYNGHPGCRNYGDAKHPGTEAMWDEILALRLGRLGGDPVYALATDDAHHFGTERKKKASPGRGWVMVRAEALDRDRVTRALLAGDFYASSGVTLSDVRADAGSLTVAIAPVEGVEYTTRFIGTRASGDRLGAIGEVLSEARGPVAAYRFVGDELYVRAVVLSSRLHPNPYAEGDRECAWVQPVVVRRPGK